jgi:hypothetical protein
MRKHIFGRQGEGEGGRDCEREREREGGREGGREGEREREREREREQRRVASVKLNNRPREQSTLQSR